MVRLFAALAGVPSYSSGIAALGLRPDVMGHCDRIDHVAKHGSQYDFGRVGNLVREFTKAVRKANDRRNDIAHAAVIRYSDGKNDFAFWLAPTETSTKKMRGFEGYMFRWNSKQVRHYAELFDQLLLECHALLEQVKKVRRLQELRNKEPKTPDEISELDALESLKIY